MALNCKRRRPSSGGVVDNY